MVSARHGFLEGGYYSRVSDAVNRTATGVLAGSGPGPAVLDAGCGEGYYLSRLASSLGRGIFLGTDISKWAIIQAAKRRSGGGILWFVAGVSRLPVGDGGLDAVLSVFSKWDPGEFHRILRNGGSLVSVTPREGHLLALRRLLYDNVFPVRGAGGEPDPAGRYFVKAGTESVEYAATIRGGGMVGNLLDMTPYSWKAPRQRVSAVREMDELEVEVSVDVTVLIRR
jgi:23S rRNA (guanine745-N1)-methyltransferase